MTAARDLDDVTVVCVTYNSRALVADMARRLRPFARLIVVDNGSRDGCAEEIARMLPRARLIARAGNGGFGAANNQAMREVRTPYALLLNPDCDIDADNVRALLRCMSERRDTALVAPQGWRPNGQPQKSWRPPFFAAQPAGGYRVPEQPIRAGWLNGCCLLADVAAFRRVGGFDERFFLYYEDDDLCLRLAEAGFDCVLQPRANVVHPGGASSGASWRVEFIKRFHYARSRQIALRRYVGGPAANLHLLRLLMIAPPAVVFYALVGRPRDCIKWTGWGLAAVCAVLALERLAMKVR